MRKLEFRDIMGYVPYGLKAVTTKTTFINPVIPGIVDYIDIKENEISYTTDEHYYLCKIEELKPYLHPISDLYKPILQDGKIPLLELASLIYKDNAEWFLDQDIDGEYYAKDGSNYNFYVELSDDGKLIAVNIWNTHGYMKAVGNITELYDKLHEWHFDYKGLIKAGLAVDINIVDS